MAFDRKQFQRVAGGLQKLFLYNTVDAIATVTASGHFNGIENEIDKGDVVLAVTAMGTVPVVETIVITSARGVSPVTTVAEV